MRDISSNLLLPCEGFCEGAFKRRAMGMLLSQFLPFFWTVGSWNSWVPDPGDWVAWEPFLGLLPEHSRESLEFKKL